MQPKLYAVLVLQVWLQVARFEPVISQGNPIEVPSQQHELLKSSIFYSLQGLNFHSCVKCIRVFLVKKSSVIQSV